ncbi:TPA: ThiF family adenylyltransferase [Pseudomonas aeruginosa]|nr:ThiF family adenylyltransferase [Pseudomonas aeruginosa]HBO4702831.1 ThiF family adenylyltransferase [Pseudomonas aeruginosa]
MKIGATFVMTEALHAALREHLFPGDGLEAAAIVLCSRHEGARIKLIARSMIQVPYGECMREVDFLRWPGSYLEQAIEQGDDEQLSIMLIHSHPCGHLSFSELDDESDQVTMRSLFAGIEVVHGTAIMTPEGDIRARLYDSNQSPTDVALVSVIGDEICFYFKGTGSDSVANGTTRPAMAFTSGMTEVLSKLSVAVIGVSGTGSVVAEQVARLGFGEVILIDHDRVEVRNLNRILNSTIADSQASALKVEVFAEAIERSRGKGVARPIAKSIGTREAVLAAADADIIFCCVDTRFGRMVADRLASRFLVPLFDVGVLIPTMKVGKGDVAIAGVYGRVDYVKPGGASLADRGVYTGESLRAESLRATNPAAFHEELRQGYIQGFHEEAPAVISLNMLAASTCVMEFLARAFPIREESSTKYSRTLLKFREAEQEFTAESDFLRTVDPGMAMGAAEPLLGLADLASII